MYIPKTLNAMNPSRRGFFEPPGKIRQNPGRCPKRVKRGDARHFFLFLLAIFPIFDDDDVFSLPSLFLFSSLLFLFLQFQ